MPTLAFYIPCIRLFRKQGCSFVNTHFPPNASQLTICKHLTPFFFCNTEQKFRQTQPNPRFKVNKFLIQNWNDEINEVSYLSSAHSTCHETVILTAVWFSLLFTCLQTNCGLSQQRGTHFLHHWWGPLQINRQWSLITFLSYITRPQ